VVSISELKSLIPVAFCDFPLADLRRKLMKCRPIEVLEFQDQELTEEWMKFVLRLVTSQEPAPFTFGQNRRRSNSEEL